MPCLRRGVRYDDARGRRRETIPVRQSHWSRDEEPDSSASRGTPLHAEHQSEVAIVTTNGFFSFSSGVDGAGITEL